MISPLLFPYTYISDTQREKILTTFGSLAMFSTRKGLEHPDSRIKTFVPVSGDENRLTSFLKEFNQYSNVNIDRASSFLKGQGYLPLVEPDGVPAIRAAVLKDISDDSINSVDPMEHLFRARVFLEIARDYDEKQHEIDQEMEGIARREKMMLDQLQGGDGPDDLLGTNSYPPDPFDDMSIEYRLSAWAGLFIHAWPDSTRVGDGFFLTTSQMAIGILTEQIPELVKVGGIDPASIGDNDLSTVLKELATCDYAEKSSEIRMLLSDRQTDVELYIAPDVSPELFFSRLTGTVAENEKEKGGVKNTVVGFFYMS